MAGLSKLRGTRSTRCTRGPFFPTTRPSYRHIQPLISFRPSALKNPSSAHATGYTPGRAASFIRPLHGLAARSGPDQCFPSAYPAADLKLVLVARPGSTSPKTLRGPFTAPVAPSDCGDMYLGYTSNSNSLPGPRGHQTSSYPSFEAIHPRCHHELSPLFPPRSPGPTI